MNDEIQSWQLSAFLRQELRKLPVSVQKELQSIISCGHHVAKDRIFLLKNDQRALLYGHRMCRNSWGCPICTPYKMMKYNGKIAAALDALKAQGFKAIMLTFTIRHFAEMSCKESTDILCETWQTYMSRSKSGTRNGKNKAANIFIKFKRECEVKHTVTVMEYTYGVNGWHPHFHMIYWVPANKFNLVADYENDIKNYWVQKVHDVTVAYWKRYNLHGFGSDNVSIDGGKGADSIRNEAENVTIQAGEGADTISNEGLRAYIEGVAGNNSISNSANFATIIGGSDNDIITNTAETVSIAAGDGNDSIYNSAQFVTISAETALKRIAITDRSGFWISKHADGRIFEINSSNYLAGFENDEHWGGNDELTKTTLKVAKPGHYTPHQMLQLAYEGNKRMLHLYINFLLTTKRNKHNRVSWSHSGLNAIIKTYMQTQTYKEFIKKKSAALETGNIQFICSFSKNEWYKITYYDHYSPFIANILWLARHDKRLLFEFLDAFDVKYITTLFDVDLRQLQATFDSFAA